MRLNLLILTFVALASALLAQVPSPEASISNQYSYLGFDIQRTLIIKPATNVNPDTGAPLAKYESIIYLKIKNVGRDVKKNIVLTEDLSYVPPNVRINFNPKPDSVGRTAVWTIKDLESGDEVQFWFSVPAIISKDYLKGMGAPKIEYSRQKASLSFPQTVEQGSSIRLLLLSETNSPISNALIKVTYPDKDSKYVATGVDGSVQIIANEEGAYAYEVQEFDAGTGQSTQSVKKPVNATANSSANGNAQKPKDKGIDLGGFFGFLPIIVAIIIVAVVLLNIYKKISTMGEDEETVSVQAGSPPKVEDGSEEEEKEEPNLPERMDKDESEEEKADEKRSGDAKSEQASSASQSKEEIEKLTKDMIMKRLSDEVDEEDADEEDEERQEENEAGPEEKAKEAGDEDAKTEAEKSDEAQVGSEIVPEEQAKQDEKFDFDDEDEDEEIDDEAIVKTIAELEQLREQLKSKGEEGEKAPEENLEERQTEEQAQEEEKETAEEQAQASEEINEQEAPSVREQARKIKKLAKSPHMQKNQKPKAGAKKKAVSMPAKKAKLGKTKSSPAKKNGLERSMKAKKKKK